MKNQLDIRFFSLLKLREKSYTLNDSLQNYKRACCGIQVGITNGKNYNMWAKVVSIEIGWEWWIKNESNE